MTCKYLGERQHDTLTRDVKYQPYGCYWTTTGYGKELHTKVVYEWNIWSIESGDIHSTVELRLSNALERGVHYPQQWKLCVGLGKKLEDKAREGSLAVMHAVMLDARVRHVSIRRSGFADSIETDSNLRARFLQFSVTCFHKSCNHF